MSDYTGTDNLEVMAEAIKYNAFLTELIAAHARSGSVIVDFGAGIGTFALRLLERGFPVHCVEPDAAQAARIARSGLPVSASLDDLPQGGADYVYTLNVLEHIVDDSAALRSLYSKLKPGGLLLIYVPAFQVLFSSMDRKVGHYRRYTRSELSHKVRAAGLQVVTAKYVDSIGYLASLLYRLFGSNDGTIDRKALVLYDRVAFPVSRVCDLLCSPFVGKNLFILARRGSVDAG